MFKIKPEYDTVTKTIRIPDVMADRLEQLAKENNISFTAVVKQCLQYALANMSEDSA